MLNSLKIEGAHVQCVNNPNAKERKLLELQITLTRHPLSISDGKMSKFMSKNKKIFIKCAQIAGAHICRWSHKTGGVY